jgi:hypothetical protein
VRAIQSLTVSFTRFVVALLAQSTESPLLTANLAELVGHEVLADSIVKDWHDYAKLYARFSVACGFQWCL